MMTLNNIKALFENIASAHYQIHGFGFGNLFEMNGEIKPGITYRCLWVVPVSSVTTDQTQQRTFQVLVIDLVKKDKSNRDEVWSDCELILNDVIKTLRNESDDYELIGESEMQPIDEAHADWVAGYGATVVLQTDFNNNYCDIPSANISAPVASPGYVYIKNVETGALVERLRPGETYYIELLSEVQQSLGTVTPTIIQVIS